jgi:hypothetical protein
MRIARSSASLLGAPIPRHLEPSRPDVAAFGAGAGLARAAQQRPLPEPTFADGSRGTESGRGQEFLDHHELPDALRGGGWTLPKRVILLRNVRVFFALLTLKPRHVPPYLFRRKHASHLCDKPRQFSAELGMSGGSVGKIQQLLADDIVERGLEPEAQFDRLGRFALLNPDFVRFPNTHRLALASIMLRTASPPS